MVSKIIKQCVKINFCRSLSQFYSLKVLVPPSAPLLTLVVFRGAVAMDFKEKEETRYALLTEELM